MKLFLAVMATLILAQSCAPALGYKGAIELGNQESHSRLNAELRCQDLLTAGQYDEALACFEALLKNSSTTDNW